MKNKQLLFILFVGVLMLTSCIKDEPLNMEADIISCTLAKDILIRPAEIGNDSITLYVLSSTNLTNLAPLFTLTAGAKIMPASGTIRDFSHGAQYYTVTSEDRNWSKRYAIRVISIGSSDVSGFTIPFSFELARTKNVTDGISYHIFYEETTSHMNGFDWASGNEGFYLTMTGNTPETFPTHQSTEGHTGKCVELITRSTGSFGALVGKPIAAGNLYIGTFDLSKAMTQPLQTTQFGTPITNKPVRITGWYNYTPGNTYVIADRNAEGGMRSVAGKEDSCNIYAVFFESTESAPSLNGENVLADDNENIISVARLSKAQCARTNGWQQFDLSFVMRQGKNIDPGKLSSGKYSFTLVMSSSINGDIFAGAIGSTLKVDDITIYME